MGSVRSTAAHQGRAQQTLSSLSSAQSQMSTCRMVPLGAMAKRLQGRRRAYESQSQGSIAQACGVLVSIRTSGILKTARSIVWYGTRSRHATAVPMPRKTRATLLTCQLMGWELRAPWAASFKLQPQRPRSRSLLMCWPCPVHRLLHASELSRMFVMGSRPTWLEAVSCLA